MAAAAGRMADVVEACRTGGGVDRDEHQALARECQASLNRPWYQHRLAGVLRGLPEIHALLARPGAMVADIGCGAGWSSVALAEAYPEARVQGFDIHPGTVARARELARSTRLEPRVTFTVADAAELPAARFDVVLAFEALHDLPHPVEVLAAARRSLRPGGCVVVMDERVAERFSAPGDDVERFSYGLSLMLSLPDALAHPGSEATGTVMRRPTLATYAARAGFAGCEVLPVEGFGRWRFYRLDP
jgi:SAM-dependent methyltransferase